MFKHILALDAGLFEVQHGVHRRPILEKAA